MYDNSPRGSVNLSRERETNTAVWVMRLFRVGIFLTFLLLVGRLYQLQVMQGENYRVSADENRFRLEEAAAPRGVVYDSSGQILVRNRPSFEVSIVPEDLPFDDLDTPDLDEEAAEIERILRALRADVDPIFVELVIHFFVWAERNCLIAERCTGYCIIRESHAAIIPAVPFTHA